MGRIESLISVRTQMEKKFKDHKISTENLKEKLPK